MSTVLEKFSMMDKNDFKSLFYEVITELSTRDTSHKKEYILHAFNNRLLVNKDKNSKLYYEAYNKYDLWLQYDMFYEAYNYDDVVGFLYDMDDEEYKDCVKEQMYEIVKEYIIEFEENDTLWFKCVKN